VVEAPKAPPKDELTLKLEKVTSSEDKAKDLKECVMKFKDAKGTARTDLLRSFIAAVEFPKESEPANIDGEVEARNECSEKTL
jgi:hypothetical protein